jgi:hypothetical protein
MVVQRTAVNSFLTVRNTHSTSAIGLALIAGLLFVGFFYGTFHSIVPPDWFKPVNARQWISQALWLTDMAMMQVLPIFPPICLGTWASVIAAIRFRPEGVSAHLGILLLPIIPMLSMPLWGAYCGINLPPDTPYGALQASWQMSILEAAMSATMTSLFAIASMILFSNTWRGQRRFGLAVLLFEVCMAYSHAFVSSMPTSNAWL